MMLVNMITVVDKGGEGETEEAKGKAMKIRSRGDDKKETRDLFHGTETIWDEANPPKFYINI